MIPGDTSHRTAPRDAADVSLLTEEEQLEHALAESRKSSIGSGVQGPLSEDEQLKHAMLLSLQGEGGMLNSDGSVSLPGQSSGSGARSWMPKEERKMDLDGASTIPGHTELATKGPISIDESPPQKRRFKQCQEEKEEEDYDSDAFGVAKVEFVDLDQEDIGHADFGSDKDADIAGIAEEDEQEDVEEEEHEGEDGYDAMEHGEDEEFDGCAENDAGGAPVGGHLEENEVAAVGHREAEDVW